MLGHKRCLKDVGCLTEREPKQNPSLAAGPESFFFFSVVFRYINIMN